MEGRGISVASLTGPRATSEALLRGAASAGILHLACHSVLDPDDFLRSGIELADRRLCVLEIMSLLDLSHSSLACLCSCDGGRPLAGRTDELMALARAFFRAGCPAVAASLWSLDDEAASAFAERLYLSWLGDGLPLAGAFRQAVLETRGLFGHPFRWAPFVLMGAWNAPPPASGRTPGANESHIHKGRSGEWVP
jgi:CHAT domain-containing protein